MTGSLDLTVARFAPVDLAELDRTARLLVRRDRKYLVAPTTLAAVLDELPAEVRAHAAELAPTNGLVPDLVPTLTTTYRRATLLLPDGAGRATIDVDLTATDVTGQRTGLPHLAIVETKSAGHPTPLDHLLWQAGIRPVRFSKYTTSLAALRPDLPANRWHPVLVEHFGRAPAIAPPAASTSHALPRVPVSLAS